MEDYLNSIINNSINNSINPAGNYIYPAMYVVGFILMLLANLFKCKVYNLTRPRSAVYTTLAGAYGMLGLILISDLYNAIVALRGVPPISNLEMLGGVIFILLCIPATVCAEKYIVNHKKPRYINGKRVPVKPVSVRDTMDSIAPGLIILSVCGKIGCHFAGCCFGVESDWGVFSPKIFKTVFPVQLCEAGTLCLILVAVYYIKQTKFFRRGMGTPITAALYLFARFCWEFLRYYNTPEIRHFFLGLSLWQIFCLVELIVPVVWIIVLYKTQPSEPMPKNYLFAKNAVRTKKKQSKNIWIQ